jgi:hypothetical protein
VSCVLTLQGNVGMCADIIFLVYVYQRWVYPVDKKRVNEFGFGGDEEKKPEALEGTEAAQDDSRAGEDRADAPRAGITEDSVSKTAAGIRSGKDISSAVPAGSSTSTKEDKKSS